MSHHWNTAIQILLKGRVGHSRTEFSHLGFGTPAVPRKLITADIDPIKASCAFLHAYSVLSCFFGEGMGDEVGESNRGEDGKKPSDDDELLVTSGSSSSHRLFRTESHLTPVMVEAIISSSC
jgi:hypothetical protein